LELLTTYRFTSFLSNIRLGCDWLRWTNVLAYCFGARKVLLLLPRLERKGGTRKRC
jgi:hypothetical protein